MKIYRFSLLASLLTVSSISTAQSLPMFNKGQLEYVFESSLVIDGKVINRDGKALVPMGAPQKGSLCYKDVSGLAMHSIAGFLIGKNAEKSKAPCQFSNLKVKGNAATFNMVCESGSKAIPSTNGVVTHTYTPSKNEVSQKFIGSNLYGKKVETTNVYRRTGKC